jgi:peptidoglycan hydrolase-like protein with peptidoglycan-binding domain
MIISNVTVRRVLGVFLSLALVFVLSVPTTRAQTIAELQAQIAALLAQIAALQAGGTVSASVCPYTWTRQLGQGSSGIDVMRLQQFLNASADTRLAVSGAGSPGMETQYYGPITAAAVSKFQVKYRAQILTPLGLVNPTGFFGPSSRAQANMLCATGPVIPPGDDDDDDGDLEGGAGSIDDYQLMSGLSNEEVGEDEEDVEVAGLEIEVSNSSDIRLTAVRLVFAQGTADSDFEDYADEVSIWLDGDEVARVDADEFDDDNDYSDTVTLDRSAVIRAGDEAELVVAISGVGNLDSNDEGETWTVDFRSIRFQDAQGASISEDPATATRTFSFEAFATAADAEFRISENDADINDGRMLNVRSSGTTSDVEIMSMTWEARGDSDLDVERFGVNVVTTGTNVDDFIAGGNTPAFYLMIDGDRYGTAEYFDGDGGSTDEDILFDDIDFTLEAGESVDVEIVANIASLAGDLDEGDTIRVTVGESETDQTSLVRVEDESGTALADGDITGSALADAHAVYDIGFVLSMVSTSASITTRGDASGGTSDIGTFTQVFDITAYDGAIAIDKSCAEDEDQGDAGEGTSVIVTNAGSNTATCSISSNAQTSGVSSNSWVVNAGQTRRFTVTTAVTATADHFAQTYLEAINWDVNANAASTTRFLTAGLGLDNTATNEIFLNDN